MPEAKSDAGKGYSSRPWLPVAASTAIMTMVAFVAAQNVKHLNEAVQWRRHSADVILSEQSFQNNLLEIQTGMRGYVTLGDTNALDSFYRNVAVEPTEIWQLGAYTLDNHTQHDRVEALVDAMTALIAFDNKAIATYRREGVIGTARLDDTGEGREAFGHVRDILDRFSAEEQMLWAARDGSEQKEYHYAGQLLITGCGLAVILVLLAHYLASRELRFRLSAESRLKQTLLLQNAILDCADYGIVATNMDGIVKTFNRAAQRLLGYSADEVVGKMTPMIWRDQAEVCRHAENLSKKLGVSVSPTFEAVAKKVQLESVDEGEWTFIRKDGSRFSCMLVVTALGKDGGDQSGFIGIFHDISERKKQEQEREELIAQLKNALAEVKTLSGMIPICAWCKNVRSDSGYWESVEQYVRHHSDADFSHGVCPTCAGRFKDDIIRANQKSEALTKA
ncbi:MAG TPA: PAS domain S-box protein [Candidatus Acidoferrales bacterium]|jgi:PAS domain S-box-containing protein|nr:PAS domain S-box protein [Candidatus Acidoferrales bacterium]